MDPTRSRLAASLLAAAGFALGCASSEPEPGATDVVGRTAEATPETPARPGRRKGTEAARGHADAPADPERAASARAFAEDLYRWVVWEEDQVPSLSAIEAQRERFAGPLYEPLVACLAQPESQRRLPVFAFFLSDAPQAGRRFGDATVSEGWAIVPMETEDTAAGAWIHLDVLLVWVDGGWRLADIGTKFEPERGGWRDPGRKGLKARARGC